MRAARAARAAAAAAAEAEAEAEAEAAAAAEGSPRPGSLCLTRDAIEQMRSASYAHAASGWQEQIEMLWHEQARPVLLPLTRSRRPLREACAARSRGAQGARGWRGAHALHR